MKNNFHYATKVRISEKDISKGICEIFYFVSLTINKIKRKVKLVLQDYLIIFSFVLIITKYEN